MFIIDTNVISELRKRAHADRKVLAWADNADHRLFYLSSITVFEVRYGALRVQRRDKIQGGLMLEWLQRDILDAFAGRILPIDTNVATECAALHVPDPKPERDAFIAATALVHNLTVVTRNVRDFEPMGVRVVNPWVA